MTTHTIRSGDTLWTHVVTPALPLAARYQVIAEAQVIDELTGTPPRVPLNVRRSDMRMDTRTAPGGHVGLAGRPAALFPDPWPAITPTVAIQISADGYLPTRLTGALPPQPGYPATFQPLDFGTVLLRRRPTVIDGRVRAIDGQPVGGAQVTVSAIWDTLPAISGPALADLGLGLTRPLSAPRPLGSTVTARALIAAAPAKVLAQAADAGALRIRLGDRQGLAVGDVLAIGSTDAARKDIATVAAIDLTSSADQRAWVTLDHPLVHAHGGGTQVIQASLGAPGPINPTTRDALPGDRTVLVQTLNGIAPGPAVIELAGGATPPELHRPALWQATADADGHYQLPPIHRLAHLTLQATHATPPTPATRNITQSGAPRARLDLSFS